MSLSYPRLPIATARLLLKELETTSVTDLAQHARLHHPAADWHPTAPWRADTATLQTLRDTLLQRAKDHGFPTIRPRGAHSTFDQQLAAELHQSMQITPAEAAAGGIWSFLALVVCPDIAVWRFPDRHPHRLIGADLMLGSSNRHVFGRLWARAEILGEDANRTLNEDEVVNILERPSIGGDRRLAQTIASTHTAAFRDNPAIARTDLMRDAMRRLRRLAVVINLQCLDDRQLRLLVQETFQHSVTALLEK